jgi:D-alanyl-D-alanine carboxypeptidase
VSSVWPFIATVWGLGLCAFSSIAGAAPEASAPVDCATLNQTAVAVMEAALRREPQMQYSIAVLCNGVITPHARGNATKNVYVLGSVTKGITATAVFALEEDGHLTLSAPAVRYVPELAPRDDITLYDLLTHRSGLADVTRLLEDNPLRRAQLADPRRALAEVAALPDLSAVRGHQQQYSSTDYVAFGIAIENVSHESFSSYVTRRVAARAGVRFHYASEGDVAPLVGLSPSLSAALSSGTATGGIICTAADVAVFDRELLGLRILSAPALHRMFAVRTGGNDRLTPGWFSSSFEGLSALWHDGAYGPYRSVNIMLPQHGIALVALTRDSTLAPASLMIDALHEMRSRHVLLSAM